MQCNAMMFVMVKLLVAKSLALLSKGARKGSSYTTNEMDVEAVVEGEVR